MAYNKKNYWMRIIDVQERFLELQDEYPFIPKNKMHKDYIYPEFKISYRTFSEYLGINAKRELKKYIEIENNQTKLFD